jgi:5-bromo-4-chloroindolyl phosphate hydrolysis protein
MIITTTIFIVSMVMVFAAGAILGMSVNEKLNRKLLNEHERLERTYKQYIQELLKQAELFQIVIDGHKKQIDDQNVYIDLLERISVKKEGTK